MRKELLLMGCFMVFGIFQAMGQIDFSNLEEEQIYRKENKYNTWSLTLGAGPVTFYGDMVDYTIFPKEIENWRFAPSIILGKQIGRAWGLEGQFLMGDMYGQKYERYFSGDFRDFTLNIRASLNQLIAFGPLADKWDLYAKVGIGVNTFRSRLMNMVPDYTSDDDYPQFWHVSDLYNVVTAKGYPTPYGWDSDDYLVLGYDRKEPTKKETRNIEMVIPIGIGAAYRVNKSFDLGLEVMMRNLTNDNMDMDMTGADNDSYMFTSFSLTFKLGKKNKRHVRWTYKDFDLFYKTKRKSDPLALKVDSLKAELEKLAGLDSVITNKTYEKHEKYVFEEGVSASVFFEFDKSDITNSQERVIARVAKALRASEDVRMLIVGHCDERGSYEYNIKLSQRRCQAVYDMLVNDFGLDGSRFEMDPKGETELLSDTKNLSSHGLHLANRRVDLMLIVNQSNP